MNRHIEVVNYLQKKRLESISCTSSHHACALVPVHIKGNWKKSIIYGENHIRPNTNGSLHAEHHALSKIVNQTKGKSNKNWHLYVIKTSKRGNNMSNSRLCERCVLAVNNAKKSGIKIKKIFYTNDNEGLTSISSTQLFNSNDHYVTNYFKNNNYMPILSCGC
jgi:hypothetical protein